MFNYKSIEVLEKVLESLNFIFNRFLDLIVFLFKLWRIIEIGNNVLFL